MMDEKAETAEPDYVREAVRVGEEIARAWDQAADLARRRGSLPGLSQVRDPEDKVQAGSLLPK